MAGVGFELRRLAGREDLSARAMACGHAALTAAGPWLVTILALTGITMAGRQVASPEAVGTFSIITIYNFCFSLVISGPVTMIATRYLADRIHDKEIESAPGLMFGALAVQFAAQAVVALPFYLVLTEHTMAERLLALASFFLTGGLWLVGIFLTTLKAYGSVTLSFAGGMTVAVVLSTALARPFGAAGMLAGFTLGLGVIFFALVAQVLAEYPHPIRRPFAFLGYFRRYADLALCGLVYNAATWVDKWIMWFAPGRTVQAGVMASNPGYDGALFMACLTIVPGMALFLMTVETSFFEHYRRFYRDIHAHATYDQIERRHGSILRVLGDGFRRISLLQAAVCYFAIAVSPTMIGFLGGGQGQLAILRFGILGALFQAMFVFTAVVLAYFDLRRVLLGVCTVFLVTNALLTLATLRLGFAYHGAGYFLAALVSFGVAYLAASDCIGRLPYLTFIGNNPSIRAGDPR